VSYKDYFKGKKIAIVGLGPHGEMLADIRFLLKNKALVSLYDMRSEERIKKYTFSLAVAGLQKFSFGKIRDEDLLDADLIILSPEISKKSNFLKKAITNNIEIEFSDTLFFKLSPPITLIGVLGIYGKSTISNLIYNILKKSFIEQKEQGLFLIDSDSNVGILNNLRKIKKGDLVVVRILENLIPHYNKLRISPHVAVITSPISFDILEFQTYNNFIVATDEVIDSIKKNTNLSIKAKMLRTHSNSVPSNWHIPLNSSYFLENASLALQTTDLFKVPHNVVQDVLQGFLGLKGRIELVKKVSGIEFYNDTASISPGSTLSALRSISMDKNVVLIFGGAYTGYDYDELLNNLSQYISTIVLLPGSGTIGLRQKIEKISDIKIVQVLYLEDAVIKAKENVRKGGKVLFSPGFDAVGIDISRKERGERFVKAVREL
jgi:UDP-N-acetylmuramoylalanine--D-glutamate ligase